MSVSPSDRQKVSDEIARELLARAAALDDHGRELAKLRDAAIEAGISGAAFDQAVREWRASASTIQMRRYAWKERIVRNLAGFVGGWVSLAAFAAADGLLGAPWLVHKLSDPAGLLLGAVIAMKLRARAATTVMAGLTIATGVEFLLDLLTGAPALHGRYPHIGLMLVGIGGVALSQWWHWRGRRQAPPPIEWGDYSSAPISAG